MNTKILITGDIHGAWGYLNSLINKKNPDVVICCGDFGYWPRHNKFDTRGIKNKDTQIFWCAGNHEDWDSLERVYGRRGRNPIELLNIIDYRHHSNIFYCPIGSTLKLNGLNFLFVGGADSVDKKYRIMGHDWFSQEIINTEDVDYVCNIKGKVDVIISHTVPMSFDVDKSRRYDKMIDPSRHALSIILEKLKPKLWYAGHWHFYMKGKEKGCNWTVLDYPGHDGQWWVEF